MNKDSSNKDKNKGHSDCMILGIINYGDNQAAVHIICDLKGCVFTV